MIRAFFFDIDGTLADCSHRLHHIEKAAACLKAEKITRGLP